jgi:hypothetical protein
MGLGGSADIKCPAAGEGDDVARAAGRCDLLAEAPIGIAGDQLLRFLDGGLNGYRVESGSDGNIDFMRRQFDAVAVGQIVSRSPAAEVDSVAFEALLHQCSNDLRKGKRVVLRAFEAGLGNRLLVIVHLYLSMGIELSQAEMGILVGAEDGGAQFVELLDFGGGERGIGGGAEAQ